MFQRFHGPQRGRRGPPLTWGFACCSGLRAGSTGTVGQRMISCAVSPCLCRRPCSRCTRALLPVAPGAHCTVWPCCVVTGPPVVGAPNAPRAPANEPANKPGGGARGAAGLRVRRRPGQCGLPRDPWAVVPKTPGPQRGAPANIHCGCCSLPPRAHKREPEQGGRDGPRLAAFGLRGCPAPAAPPGGSPSGRPHEQRPPEIRRPFVICVLSPVQSLPAVLLSAGPCIR